MIRVSAPIDKIQVDELDELLNEIAPSPWLIRQDTNNNRFFLEGFFKNLESFKKFKRIGILTQILSEESNLEFQSLEDCDWTNAYKKHFKPWSFKSFHWIPVWMKNSYNKTKGHKFLYLDPGMAFGTGNHETTRLCLEELLKLEVDSRKWTSLLDLGCGSGIISLTAAKISYQRILGIDIDPDSIRISKENAELNSVDENLELRICSIESLQDLEKFNVVIANIQADILTKFGSEILNQLGVNATLILSGILASEVKDVKEYFINLSKRLSYNLNAKERTLGEWAVITLSSSVNTEGES